MNELHLFTGDGQGKTCAAMGLALRMLGHGRRVVLTQFLKDGSSGEIAALSSVPGFRRWPGVPLSGFWSDLDASERIRMSGAIVQDLENLAENLALDPPDLLVLDELTYLSTFGIVPEDTLTELIQRCLAICEVAVTGRSAPEWLISMAGYVSEIRCVAHPFQRGAEAREGIEY